MAMYMFAVYQATGTQGKQQDKIVYLLLLVGMLSPHGLLALNVCCNLIQYILHQSVVLTPVSKTPC